MKEFGGVPLKKIYIVYTCGFECVCESSEREREMILIAVERYILSKEVSSYSFCVV